MSRGSQVPLGDRLATGPRGISSTLAQIPPLRSLINALSRLPVSGHHAVIGLPYLWLGLFFLVPFVIVLKISFADQLIVETCGAGGATIKVLAPIVIDLDDLHDGLGRLHRAVATVTSGS